jgi:hypothetical protein
LKLIDETSRSQDPLTGQDDVVVFHQFSGIVIGLSPEQVTTLEKLPGKVGEAAAKKFKEGVFSGISKPLYETGFDSYYFSDDSVNGPAIPLLNGDPGGGSVFQEIVRSQDRAVSHISMYGFSHGGGAVPLIADKLAAGFPQGVPNTSLSLDVTAYIDAIKKDFVSAERRYPVGSHFHYSYFQDHAGPPRGNYTLPPAGANQTIVDNIDVGPVENAFGFNDSDDVDGFDWLSALRSPFSLALDPHSPMEHIPQIQQRIIGAVSTKMPR